MYLTPIAKQLLDNFEILQLQALPFEELIANHEEVFQRQTNDALSLYMTAPAGAQDGVNIETLVDPVVVSSGHVYSRQTVEQLFATHDRTFGQSETPLCPNTRERLLRGRIIQLPEINLAIAKWKFNNACQQEAATLADQSLNLTIKVGHNKIRVYLDGMSSPFEKLLEQVFRGENNHSTRNSQGAHSYSATNWSFVWMANESKTFLEWWFPTGTFNDDGINQLIAAIMQPLNLPAAHEDEDLQRISMASLQPRQYVTAVENLILNHESAGKCLMSFLQKAMSLRQAHAYPGFNFEDRVVFNRHPVNLPRRQELGMGMFGPNAAAAASAGSAAQWPTSLPSSQSQAARLETSSFASASQSRSGR